MIFTDNGLRYTHETPAKDEIHQHGEPRQLDYVAVAVERRTGEAVRFPKTIWYWGTELQAFKLLNCWNRRGEHPSDTLAHWSFYAV